MGTGPRTYTKDLGHRPMAKTQGHRPMPHDSGRLVVDLGPYPRPKALVLGQRPNGPRALWTHGSLGLGDRSRSCAQDQGLGLSHISSRGLGSRAFGPWV